MYATAVLLSQYTRTVYDSIVGPSEVGPDEWLLIPANWCGVWILVGTKLRKAVVSANWLPSPWEMHLWRRRDGSGRRNGTPVITEGWRNQRRYDRNSESSLIWVSHDWRCWVHWSLNQSWRKRRWRRPWVINGAKWDSLLIIDETLRADMTVDGDRRERTSVRVGKNESGGDIRACSKLKWRPRKSSMRVGCNIDLSQFIVHPSDWSSWRTCCVWRRLSSFVEARMIQSSRYAWTWMPRESKRWTTGARVLVNSLGAVERPNGRTLNW